MADFILAVRIAAIAGGMDAAAARKMERQLRRDWGGERVYLAKLCAAKELALADLIAAGELPARAIRSLGLPDSTGYRLLSRKWSPKG